MEQNKNNQQPAVIHFDYEGKPVWIVYSSMTTDLED